MRTLPVSWNFLLPPDFPSPYFGLLVCWFLWLLFSTRVTYLRVLPAGSWTACPRSERRFSISLWVRYAGQFLAGHPASVCGYLRAMSLRVCCLVVLIVCYRWVTLSSLQGFSRSLVRGLGCSFVPYPLFCRLGLVPRSVAQLCALLPFVPSFRVCLSLLCAPLAVGLLPGSHNRLCPLSADCLLGLEPSPSGVASASDGRFSWHPGAAGALAVPSPEAASLQEFFPLCLVLPLKGSVTFSRVCSSVGGHVGVAHSFLPSLLLGGSLVRFCGGLC